METKLYVGNFSQQIKERELRGLFSKAGKVLSVDLIQDPQTGKSKGFAFVEMLSPVDAVKAIRDYDGYALDQHALKVCLVQPSERNHDRRFRGHPLAAKRLETLRS